MKKQFYIGLFMAWSSVLLFAGCSSNATKFEFDSDKTMKDIYKEKFDQYQGVAGDDVARDIQDDDADLNNEVKQNIDMDRNQFGYLPNPILVMYIYPHLTDAGTPVPGYTTFFKFYEQDNVGLPWELNRKVAPEGRVQE